MLGRGLYRCQNRQECKSKSQNRRLCEDLKKSPAASGIHRIGLVVQ